jgi:hypothetical protein
MRGAYLKNQRLIENTTNTKMEVVHFIYNEQTIDFLPKGDDKLMVNATQMAKVFGKLVGHFLENESTEKFINSCLNNRNSDYLGVKKREDLVDSKQKSGTWMHRILALKFAAWLDPDFEVWVFSTIDQILLGHYREIKEATIEKLVAENELAKKKQELILKNPELAELFELELKITAADKKRAKALKASVMQLKFDLFPQQN